MIDHEIKVMAEPSKKDGTVKDTRALALPAEVAEHLRKPEGTLRNWRYLGQGPRWIKLENGSVRYRWSDVESWLDEQSKAAA